MSELFERPNGDDAEASEITIAAEARSLHTAGRMKISIASCVRSLSLAALWSLGGCAGDNCATSSLRLEMTPSPACLQLSATADTQPGSYHIVGTNSCADPLVVHSPFTHDGGANYTFPAGAQVSIPLDDSEVFNQDTTVKTWERNAVLGSETIKITVTKMPC